jgi:ATP-binding cassette subfamily B protein
MPRSAPLGPALLLRRLLAAHAVTTAASIACGSAASILSLAPHAAIAAAALLLDQGAGLGGLAPLALGLAVAILARHALFAASTGLSHRVAFDAQRRLREALAGALAAAPLGYVLDRPAGALRGVVLDDVEAVEDGLAHLVPETTAAAVAPLALLGLLAWLDWRLALAATLPVFAGLGVVAAVMRRSADITRAYYAGLDAMNAAATELVQGMPTVRAFDAGGAATARLARAFQGFQELADQWIRRSLAPAAAAQLLLGSAPLIVLPAGLALHAAGAIEPWRLIVFLALSLGFGNLFAALVGLAYRISQQVEALSRIARLLAAPALPQDGARAVPRDASIEFRDVRFAYAEGGREALAGLSFRVPPGGSLALVGPSGAGKSTAARLIPRLWDPTGGAVLLGGIDLRDIAPEVLPRHVAFVFQEVVLFRASIGDNVRLGRPEAGDAEVEAACRAARIHDMIMALPEGYATLLADGGAGLSGGERQRLAIARALLMDAPVLVLDEATAHADTESEAELQQAVAALAADRTLIVIAHRLATGAGCDEILVLEDGAAVEAGSHAALLAAGGRYAAMWAAHRAAEGFRFRDDAAAMLP